MNNLVMLVCDILCYNIEHLYEYSLYNFVSDIEHLFTLVLLFTFIEIYLKLIKKY
jgi:hypothetical protein